MIRSLRSLVLPVVLAGAAASQVTVVPGTGCPNASPTTFAGAPTLGGTMIFSNTGQCQGGPNTYLAVIMLGVLPAAAPELSCVSPTPCIRGLEPFHVAFAAGFASYVVQMPTNPAWTGLCFRVQASCVFWHPVCAHNTDQALEICIQ